MALIAGFDYLQKSQNYWDLWEHANMLLLLTVLHNFRTVFIHFLGYTHMGYMICNRVTPIWEGQTLPGG